MYAIYGNIYHQHTPNVSIYTSTMDPMGYDHMSKNDDDYDHTSCLSPRSHGFHETLQVTRFGQVMSSPHKSPKCYSF